MIVIKYIFNRDVFLSNDERLIGFVYVIKVGRKKKISFFCVVCKFFFFIKKLKF